MRIKCPSCFAEFDLVSALDSDAGRELMLRLATLDAALSRPLTVYISLFRSASRALSWDRALRLVDETLALDADRGRLAQGLAKAVESLREKQKCEGWKPMANHNYLKRTLEGLPVGGQQQALVPKQYPETPPAPQLPTSKTGQAMMKLEALKRGRQTTY